MEIQLEPRKTKMESVPIDVDSEIDLSMPFEIESNLNELFMRAAMQGSMLSVTDDILEMFQESEEAADEISKAILRIFYKLMKSSLKTTEISRLLCSLVTRLKTENLSCPKISDLYFNLLKLITSFTPSIPEALSLLEETLLTHLKTQSSLSMHPEPSNHLWNFPSLLQTLTPTLASINPTSLSLVHSHSLLRLLSILSPSSFSSFPPSLLLPYLHTLSPSSSSIPFLISLLQSPSVKHLEFSEVRRSIFQKMAEYGVTIEEVPIEPLRVVLEEQVCRREAMEVVLGLWMEGEKELWDIKPHPLPYKSLLSPFVQSPNYLPFQTIQTLKKLLQIYLTHILSQSTLTETVLPSCISQLSSPPASLVPHLFFLSCALSLSSATPLLPPLRFFRKLLKKCVKEKAYLSAVLTIEVVASAAYEEKESEKMFLAAAEFVLYPKNFLRWSEAVGKEGVGIVITSITKREKEVVDKVGYKELWEGIYSPMTSDSPYLYIENIIQWMTSDAFGIQKNKFFDTFYLQIIKKNRIFFGKNEDHEWSKYLKYTSELRQLKIEHDKTILTYNENIESVRKKRDVKRYQKNAEETLTHRLQEIRHKMTIAQTNLDNLSQYKNWVRYEILNNCHYLMTLRSLSIV